MSEDKSGQNDLSNLSSDREDFFEAFFKKGAEFAAELLQELNSLRSAAQFLKNENIELKHQLASEGAIRDLLEKIDQLEKEKKSLKDNVEISVRESENYADRYQEVEKELDTMANLYVALYQLHSTLLPNEVLGVIEQLLAQFIGAGSFVIYLKRELDGEKMLLPVHAYHCKDAAGKRVPWNEGPIGETAATGVHFVADPRSREDGAPLACIPMIFGGDTIGVIVILSFFEQKAGFVDMDFKFFKLLAVHSASAVVSSGLMARAQDLSWGLESYQHL
jgi:hypothetical protein